jgi:hypothetical protein
MATYFKNTNTITKPTTGAVYSGANQNSSQAPVATKKNYFPGVKFPDPIGTITNPPIGSGGSSGGSGSSGGGSSGGSGSSGSGSTSSSPIPVQSIAPTPTNSISTTPINPASKPQTLNKTAKQLNSVVQKLINPSQPTSTSATDQMRYAQHGGVAEQLYLQRQEELRQAESNKPFEDKPGYYMDTMGNQYSSMQTPNQLGLKKGTGFEVPTLGTNILESVFANIVSKDKKILDSTVKFANANEGQDNAQIFAQGKKLETEARINYTKNTISNINENAKQYEAYKKAQAISQAMKDAQITLGNALKNAPKNPDLITSYKPATISGYTPPIEVVDNTPREKTREEITYEKWMALTDEQKRIAVGGSRAQAGAETEALRQQARLSVDLDAKRRLEAYGAGQVALIGLAPIALGATPLVMSAGLIVSGLQGSKIGQEIGNPFTNQKPTSDRYTQEEATKYGLYKSEEKSRNKLTDTLIYDFVPGGQVTQKETFIQGTQDYLIKEKGYAPAKAYKEANALYEKYVVGGAIGEVAGMVTLSGGTEILGRTLVKSALKGTVIKATAKQAITSTGTKQFIVKPAINIFSKQTIDIAFKSGKAIAKAGAVEGFGFYELERTAKMKEFNPIDAGIYTAGGAISAGVIGGSLVAGSFAMPRTTKWLQRGFYAIDPTEKPGDIIGDSVSKYVGINFSPRVKYKVTTILPTMTQTKTQVNLTGNKPKAKGKANVFINTAQKNPNVSVNTNFDIFPQSNVGTKTQTNIGTNTSTSTATNVFVNTKTQTNIGTITNTNTGTNMNTNTNTNTNTNVNVNTNVITGFPPFPMGGLIGGFGSGRGGRFGVKNKTNFKSLFATKTQYVRPSNKIRLIGNSSKVKVVKQANGFFNAPKQSFFKAKLGSSKKTKFF